MKKFLSIIASFLLCMGMMEAQDIYGFTPQYEELEDLYRRYGPQGLEILDFPCNQFGGQAPGTEQEIAQFCSQNYDVHFRQFKKVEVNGENEIPLYTWLKARKGFEGFDKGHQLSETLHNMFVRQDPDYASKPDIKWNFTKFLIDREGNVVARFEPTATKVTMLPAIQEELAK